VPPLLVLSFAIEGGPAMWHGVRDADLGAWAAVLWQSVANTLFGFAVWTWLLARYPAAAVTPTALLVPVFGLGASALMLGEPLPAWKIAAVLLVLAGLALNLWWPRWRPLAGR
jgi:O-acetylserine/cysteine efflux transporter